MHKSQVVLATKNKGKIEEFQALFQPFHREARSVLDFSHVPDVEEDGETFVDNAIKKAKTIAEALHTVALADDSGLCVDALNGRPGVYSARFAGVDATDERNNMKLLREMEDVSLEKRTARFHCVIALVEPGHEPIVVEGTCEGTIAYSPQGEHGFGYDPLFYLPAYDKTMAQLPSNEKNRISHRAKAMQKLKEVL